MRKLLLALMFVAMVLPSVHAAATISEIYAAPSEGEKFYGGSGICQNLDTSCTDEQFASVTDVYSLLGDGSTAAASAVTIENKSSSQSGYLRLVYHLDGVLDGTYELRLGHKQGQTGYNGQVCAYLPDAVSINGSSCVSFSHIAGEQWHEVDVDTLVRRSAARFNGAVILRVQQTSGGAVDMAEVYLKRPFKESDFQIIPQGVTTGDVNQWLENEWLISSQADIALTNASCSVWEVDEPHVMLNATSIEQNVNITEGGAKLVVRWFSNSSVVTSGKNYEVQCDVLAGTAVLVGLEQYVYMTVDGGIFADLTELVENMLRLLGFIEQPVEVRQLTTQVPGEGPVNLLAQVTMGGDLETNATCNVTVAYANGTQLFTEASMTNQNTGLYNLTFSSDGGAPYDTQIACLVNNSAGELKVYRTVGSIQAGVREVYEGTPEIVLLESQYHSLIENNIMTQLRIGSNEVDDATCDVTVYYPNGTKSINAAAMSYFGENGFYNYSWTPGWEMGSHPAHVHCQGGKLGTKEIETAGSLFVTQGVNMRSIT